jgi:hypothetical protein
MVNIGMSSDKFWSSKKGVLLQLQRRKFQQLRFHVDCELESKASNKHSHAFQTEIRDQMAKQGRVLPFRVPVVLEMDFTPSIDRPPPAIHSLPKHYLDLLQWPAGSSANCKHRLPLQDDRLVKGLICTYWLGIDHENPGVRLRIATMTNFVRDLQLCRRILNGELAAESGSSQFDQLPDLEDEPYGDPSNQYREHLRDKDRFVSATSEEAYEIHRMFLQQQLQERILGLKELGPDRLAFLLLPNLSKRSRSLFSDLAALLASQVRQWHSLIAIDLGPSAVRKGESDRFKQTVREKLAAVRKDEKLMSPLLTTLGVTILYVPPENADLIDLDNLARRVIPFVHEELHPPATLQHVAKLTRKL